MTKNLDPFLSELVWSIKRGPELSAKKNCLSLSPASTLSQKNTSYINTHTLPSAQEQDLTLSFPVTPAGSGI